MSNFEECHIYFKVWYMQLYSLFVLGNIPFLYTHSLPGPDRLWLPCIVAIILAVVQCTRGKSVESWTRSSSLTSLVHKWKCQTDASCFRRLNHKNELRRNMFLIRKINRRPTFLASFLVHRFPEQATLWPIQDIRDHFTPALLQSLIIVEPIKTFFTSYEIRHFLRRS